MAPSCSVYSTFRRLRLTAPLGLLCGLAIAFQSQAADLHAGSLSFIDLGSHANQRLSEDFHGYPGNNLKPLPRGRQRFASVPFYVGDGMVQLAGKRAPDFPTEVRGVQVEHECEKLYFLHGTGWGSPGVADGTKIGFYRVNYANGSEEEIPIVYGEDVRDWWQLADSRGASRADIGWTGMNAASRDFRNRAVELRLFVRPWENPKPDVPISSIDLVSLNETMSSPFLIAVTCKSSVSEDKAIERLREEGVLVKTNEGGNATEATLSTGRVTRETVALLAHLPQLRRIDLSNNRLPDIAAVLPNMDALRALTLNFTDTTDEVVEQAVKMPSLRVLRLHHTNVTDRSAVFLADSDVEVLDLSDTQITDEAVPHLAQMQNLDELDLRDTRVTESGIEKLQKALAAEIRYP